jgi:hypothetical protein
MIGLLLLDDVAVGSAVLGCRKDAADQTRITVDTVKSRNFKSLWIPLEAGLVAWPSSNFDVEKEGSFWLKE